MPTSLLLASMLLASAPRAQNIALDQLGADAGRDVAPVAASLEKSRALAAEGRPLFSVKEEKDRRLLELRGDQLEVPYLFAATVDRGTAENGIYSATMARTFVGYFRQVGEEKVQLLAKSLARRAAPGTPEEKAISESYPDSLIATLPIVALSTTAKTVSLDVRALFLMDLIEVHKSLQEAYDQPVRLSKEDSTLESVKTFPKNMEVDVRLQFQPREPVASATLSDSRLLPVGMHYSVSALPSTPGFEPRPADERVGYFQTSYQDLTDAGLKETLKPSIHLINHWHLEKADPAAPVSDVKKPIVYWLDQTVPLEYRSYVRDGILAWNAAFEAAGLRNAVVVKEVDKDMPAEERARFDPANASYNVVRWFMGESTSMGVAPSRVNPMTGEIFNASIRLGDQLTRVTTRLTELATGLGPSPSAFHEHDPSCAHWRSLREAAAALVAAESAGPLSPERRKEFTGQLLTQLTAHEAGHTLGLRHNFRGGALHPLEQAGKDGLVASSVMHYIPPNIAPAGRPQGAYYQNKVGPYDEWAIEYGYKPLSGGEADRRVRLKEIAARSGGDARLRYCTDEDAGGTDPDCQRFILGRDPVAYARYRTALGDGVLRTLETRASSGEGANLRLRDGLQAGLAAYDSATAAVLPVIGGVRSRRGASGDGPAPFEAVPAAEQREALKFLDEKVFGVDAFNVPPSLLNRAAIDRLDTTYRPASPYPLPRRVFEIQSGALNHIYGPATLQRLSDSALYGQTAVTAGETMITVRKSIWKEIEGRAPAAIAPMRRTLQREHLGRLTSLLVSDKVVGDARAQARRDLQAISSSASAALETGVDDSASAAHLEDMRRLADEALGVQRTRPSA